MDLREGGDFAGYRVVRKLGAGGMGQVWLVENPHLRRLEAMKIVSTSGAGDDFARRFTTEAQTAAGLDHPNIVTVYAYGIEGDAAWFTMSHLEGEDLVRAGALPPAEVATIVERVADAVDYANSRGVIHRDIKPANIIVRRGPSGQIDRVTVLDFGIAKVMDGTNLTATNAFIGTLTYAPPESLTGGGVVAQSDQYSLAATAFQLLTGRPPFRGENPGALMMAHITGPIPRVSDLAADLSPFDDAITRGLAKEPQDRFPTSREFSATLCGAAARVSTVALTSRPQPDPRDISTMVPPARLLLASRPPALADTPPLPTGYGTADDAILRNVASTLLALAPPYWISLHAEFGSIGDRHQSARVTVTSPGGEYRLPVSPRVQQMLTRHRYHGGVSTGRWETLLIHAEARGGLSVELDDKGASHRSGRTL